MKMRMSAIGKLIALAVPAAVAFPTEGWACPTVSLPLPTASNSVSFGDSIDFALPILNISVQSSPGQIQDCIVVATGSSGTNITQNAAGFDDAYATPSGTGGSPFFRTGDPVASPDPGSSFGSFTGQTNHTWDAQLSALQTFLAGGTPIVLFNHNQVNSGASTNQDLVLWAQIAVVDNQDPTRTKYFYLTSVPNATGIPNFGAPGGNPLAYTGPQTAATNTYPSGSDATGFPTGGVGTGTGSGDANFFALAQGQVCLNGPVGVGTPVPCSGPHVATVNLNLGANEVAEAVIFPEINAILNTPGFDGYDVLQADIRMGCNPATITTNGGVCPPPPFGAEVNNGFEQIFIISGAVPVPEPGTVALLGLALVLVVLGWPQIRGRKH